MGSDLLAKTEDLYNNIKSQTFSVFNDCNSIEILEKNSIFINNIYGIILKKEVIFKNKKKEFFIKTQKSRPQNLQEEYKLELK